MWLSGGWPCGHGAAFRGLKSILIAVNRLVASALAIGSFYAYLRSLAPIYWDFELALAVAIGLALWGWPTYAFARASGGNHSESKPVSGYAQFVCMVYFVLFGLASLLGQYSARHLFLFGGLLAICAWLAFLARRVYLKNKELQRGTDKALLWLCLVVPIAAIAVIVLRGLDLWQ
jgi:hypothetical protein